MTDTRTTPLTETGDDVIEVLLEQHTKVKAGMSSVLSSTGEERRRAFDEVRALLAMHETAEEMVLRPVTRDVAGEGVADARNREEHAASEVLARLEDMDVDDAAFTTAFTQFQQDVLRHATHEETLEFPRVVAGKDRDERADLGRMLRRVERMAPTHPHPTAAGSTAANWTIGPFAAMVDRARDAVRGMGEPDGPRDA